MFTSTTRRRAAALTAALATAVLAMAAPADAAPWGTSGADYTGVLCRLGTTDVPMGAWTVNGSVSAFSTADVTGTGGAQGSAPVSGTPSTMTAGDAGFGADDIATVAYLLDRHRDGSVAELAQLSADVAAVGGGGQQQRRCLGQQGTSAARAASWLDEARRLAGPYTIDVSPERDVIPGRDAEITVTVRSASGAGVRDVPVTITAGSSVATATTGGNGRARTSVIATAQAATRITATASLPTGLTYLDTTPPSVAAAPLSTVTGTGELRPLLHPRPTVRVTSDQLAFADDTLRPQLTIGGTFGYTGTGQVVLAGPVASTGECTAEALAAAPVAWQQPFTFTGDATLRAGPTSRLVAGCYVLRASVTVTNSSPPERASAAPLPVVVSGLQVAAKASAPAARPGGVSAVVTATDAGRATVRTTVVARGPLPIAKGRCSGDFRAAPIAGRSSATKVAAATTVPLPDVRRLGCYALVARSDVTLDGRSATIDTPTSDATMAVLDPGVVVNTAAVSSERGKPVPGTVQVTGTFGFPGTVSVGVVAGEGVPITGCRDTRFASALTPASTSRVAVRGDASYDFRTPPPAQIACYSVVATYTLTGNADVTATSAAGSAIFLAGKRPGDGVGTVLLRADAGSPFRAAVAYGVFGVLMLLGCLALFVRIFRRNRVDEPGDPIGPLFR